MATLPTPEENARMVLKIFSHFNRRHGETLSQKNLIQYALAHNIRTTDISSGVDYGADAGWFDQGPRDTVLLTEAGFAESERN